MPSWGPDFHVQYNRVIDLNRGSAAVWEYHLDHGKEFPEGTTAFLELRNSYGQLVDEWDGTVAGGTIAFEAESAVADVLPAGTSWVLFADMNGLVRSLAQGTVIRSEAPFPDAPVSNPEFDAKMYSYAFGTPGRLYDPAWRILAGRPFVHDNSGRDLPNAVAAGTLLDDLTLWPKVAMLWFAPMNGDGVRFNYNVVRENDGEAIIVLCSNYDMTNWVGIHHKQVFGVGSWDDDQLAIVTGTGPTTYATRVTQDYDTANLANFTAEYNPTTNTYAVYKGTDLTPLIEWTDSTNVVDHGPGERYVGLAFESALLSPGVEISDWKAQDYVG